jgi:short-subunit dehydrogenase
MDELKAPRPLAVVTGASSGIGFHLARIAAEHGYDLIVAADTPLGEAVAEFQAAGAQVHAVQADLASTAGVQHLIGAIGEREVDALMANAGHGLGGSFLAQDFDEILHVINTNIVGTLRLIQHIARGMVARARGRILVTGSVAGLHPGSFEAVYAATKAFVDSFSHALRGEIRGTGVTVSCLMPGPTQTDFFARADMLDTKVGQMRKADPAKVARIGFDAMLKGEADVVAGWLNKVTALASRVAPPPVAARMHGKFAEPKGQT